MNPQETAQAVLDQIRMNPETHWQGAYESPCGTTRCVAGWAAYLHGCRQIETGLRIEPDGSRELVHNIAADCLGLSEDDAIDLFSASLPAAEAVHALEYLAKGEKIDWRAVKGIGYARLEYERAEVR